MDRQTFLGVLLAVQGLSGVDLLVVQEASWRDLPVGLGVRAMGLQEVLGWVDL